jgi:cardiolipin synthase
VTSPEPAQVSSRILTVPNLLSFFRLLMVPVFLYLILIGEDLLALIVLVVSTATDFFDGLIARRFGQISRLGQLLDPAADRLFIFATLVGLAIREILPWWVVAAIIGRDALLLLLGVILANVGYGPLPVHHLGKTATFCLFWGLPVIVLGHAVPAIALATDPIGWAFTLWGTFLYWWAGVIYARQATGILRKSRKTSDQLSDTLGLREGK